MSDDSPGTLGIGEFHPSAPAALQWVKARPLLDQVMWQESFASTAISGNRAAEVLGETYRRVLDNEPVSDRYILGLAWAMRHGDE